MLRQERLSGPDLLSQRARTPVLLESPRGPYCLGAVGVLASGLAVTAAPQLRQNLAAGEFPAPHRGQRAVAALATISWTSAPHVPQNLLPSGTGAPQVQVAIGFSPPAGQGWLPLTPPGA